MTTAGMSKETMEAKKIGCVQHDCAECKTIRAQLTETQRLLDEANALVYAYPPTQFSPDGLTWKQKCEALTAEIERREANSKLEAGWSSGKTPDDIHADWVRSVRNLGSNLAQI